MYDGHRQQNSLYFCAFNYALAVKQKVRGWKQRAKLGPFVWLLARSWMRKNTDCFSVPIVHNLVWAPLKNSSSSSAATTSWSILMGGFLELSYGLSFLVVTILVSTFQFVSSKSIYQERGQDFLGARTIFKTYPNLLLSSLVRGCEWG